MVADTEVKHFRCARCGFEYFDGRFAGGPRFYEELSRAQAAYYPSAREEFHRAAALARESGARRILDVGAGHGHFLDLVKAPEVETAAVELNPDGARVCRGKGHAVFERLVHELTPGETGGAFDLVTAFQVVEHVADPVAFLRAMSRLVAPGGFAAIGVPFASGVCRLAPCIPHQWPPHHVTRWRHRDLRALGAACGMEVWEQASDRLAGGDLRHFAAVNSRMAAALGRPVSSVLTFLATTFGRAYAALGLDRLPVPLGTNAYAVYRKP